MRELKKYIVNKILHIIFVLIGITFISFVLANISEVDPAEAYARKQFKGASIERIEEIRREMGFDKPIHVQYWEWLTHVVRFDFGVSYITNKPVMEEIANALPNTIILTVLAASMILMLSVLLGILSAKHEGKFIDTLVSVFSFFSLSIPGYFAGLLSLLLFGVQLKILPIIGHGYWLSMVFAALVLALPMIGSLSKILRALLLENKQADYILYARARGISKRNIMYYHLLRNAAPPCVTMFGQSLGYLIAGTAVVETIFSCTGLGMYAVNAALNRDFPVITGYVLVMALFFIICNLLADVAGLLLNPRSRNELEGNA